MESGDRDSITKSLVLSLDTLQSDGDLGCATNRQKSISITRFIIITREAEC